MKDLLGGKGANLCEMTNIGLPVPPGMTITTEACNEYYRLGGRLPVNPSGGRLSLGHPLGATGVAQVVELSRQLQGRCGDRQAEGAKTALAHVQGGSTPGIGTGAAAVHILTV